MIDILKQHDHEIFIFLNNLGSSTWDGFWLVVTSKLTFIPLYLFLMYLIYRKLGLKGLIISVIVIALMVTFTDQITNLFKRSFERLRPCRQEGIMEYIRIVAPCGKYGFFSGHSSNSMAAALFWGLMLRSNYNKLLYILIIWSLFVAYSRIYVGVHYPLDIICGMLFGALSGFMFYKINKYFLNRFSI